MSQSGRRTKIERSEERMAEIGKEHLQSCRLLFLQLY